MKNVFLDWINYQNRPFIQYAAPPRNSYLYLVSRLCTWHEAMLAQEKDEGRLDCQDGVAHSNAVARPLTKHHQPKLVGRVFWRKVFRIKDGGVLEVLLVPFGGVWSAIFFPYNLSNESLFFLMYEGFLLGKVRSGIRLDPDLHLVRSLPWRPRYSSHLIQKFF